MKNFSDFGEAQRLFAGLHFKQNNLTILEEP